MSQNPQYPGYPGYPPQGYPQQQPAQPQQPAAPNPYAPPAGYQPPQGQPPAQPQAPQMPPPPATMPQYQQINPDVVAQAYQGIERGDGTPKGRGNRPTFVNKIPVFKWQGTVPIGTSLHGVFHLCPHWADMSRPPFVLQKSHFWKGGRARPHGNSINHVDGQCLICDARKYILDNMKDGPLVDRARNVGFIRRKWLYNVLFLDDPSVHLYQDGQMKPLVLDAGKNLHADIKQLVDTRGPVAIFDFQQGRPIRFSKTKSGPEMQNVDWGCIDLDPAPIPQALWACIPNLWNLDELAAGPDQAAQADACRDIGLPLPGEPLVMAQVPPQYGQGWQQPPPAYAQPAAPAYAPPPYQPPPPAAPAPPPPVYSAPGAPATSYAPQPAYAAQPAAPAPQAPPPAQPAGPPPPPPVTSAPPPPPAPGGAPPPPPPVSSAPPPAAAPAPAQDGQSLENLQAQLEGKAQG